MTSPRFRTAVPDDARSVALLHADSWRRHYRGAYTDTFLDEDAVADRLSTWSSRFAAPVPGETVLAEDDGGLVGFVHVVFDVDDRWGSLVDNLHVTHDRKGSGIGGELLTRAAEAVAARAADPSMYLWVLQQNTAAQGFYRAFGGVHVETAAVASLGGSLRRLNGSPDALRIAWPDASSLVASRRVVQHGEAV